MNVDLHIEELILEGFPASYRTQIAEIVQNELARIFAERGASSALPQGMDVGSLDGGAFNLARGASVHHVGTQVATAIANSVYGGAQ